MAGEVDARGLSCPQPVLLTLDAIKKAEKGEIEILVDTETAKENVCRAVKSRGWRVGEIVEDGEFYRIVVCKP